MEGEISKRKFYKGVVSRTIAPQRWLIGDAQNSRWQISSQRALMLMEARMSARVRGLNGFHSQAHPLRRRNVRIPCNVLARVEAPQETVRGLCTDLSLGGMLFLGPSLEVGERVDVTLDLLQSGSVRLRGEVLELRAPAGGPAMAIRFPELGPRELKAINRFVAFQLA